MRNRRAQPPFLGPRRLAAVVAVCGVLVASMANAQPVGPDTKPLPETPAAKPGDAAGIAWPDTTVWVDDDGVPRPLVGWTYEEFAKAWRASKGLESAKREPSYTLHAVRAEGALGAEDQPGMVRLAVTIELQVHEPQRIALPIRFADAIFTGELTGLDPDREYLAYDAERGGYLLWLDGGASSERRDVGITLLAPVRGGADGARVELNLPRATQSEVDLVSATPIVSPTVSEGILLPVESTSDGGSRLALRGAVGPTTIAYRSPVEKRAAPQTLLRARGELEVLIDDRSVRSTASITVDGLGRPFERFFVRLPRGATRLPDSEARADGVRIEVVDPAVVGVAGLARDEDSLLVEVSRADRSTAPLTAKLVTATPLGSRQGDGALDLAGFDVVGAVLQNGDVAITVDEGVQVDWGEQVGASRIETSQLPEALARQSPSFAVRYYRQSWRLPVSIGAREARVEATPTFRLEVLPDEARLTMDAEYRVFGGGVLEFACDLNGWPAPTEDPVGPVGLIDLDHTRESGTRWIVPLTRAASRRALLTIPFRQPLDDGAPIDLRLPMPIADSLGVGRLVVVVDPSVELQVDADQTEGLEPVAVEPDPNSSDDPAALRTRAYRLAASDAGGVRLVAERRSRPGRLEANSRSSVKMTAYASDVDQALSFDARYQPVDHILIWAPDGIVLDGESAFELTGEAVLNTGEDAAADAVKVPAEPVDFEGLPRSRSMASWEQQPGTVWRVVLPGPRLGEFALRTQYPISHGLSADGLIEIPLLRPVLPEESSEGSRSVVDAMAPDGQAITLAAEASGWEAQTAGEPEPTLRAVGGADAGPLQLRIAPLPNTPAPSAIVDQAWFQTWESGGQRQTRAAFLVVDSSDTLEMVLPEGLEADSVEFRVDGRRIVPSRTADGRLILRDEVLSDGEEHTIATRSLTPIDRRFTTRLLAPRIVADTTLAECYWEVIHSSNKHVISTPAGMAGLYRWAWSDRGWGRQPTMETAELAELTGAEVGPPLPAGEHRYLFYGSGATINEPRVRSVSRTAAVLVASAAFLVIAFLLSQAKLFRYRATHYALVLSIGAVGLITPGPFVFVMQAGAIGLSLAAATLLAIRFVSRGQRHTPIILPGQSTSLGGATPRVTDKLAVADSVSTNAPTVSVAGGDGGGES